VANHAFTENRPMTLIEFWSLLILLTLAAWGCLFWPIYQHSAAGVSVYTKIGIIAFPVLPIGFYLLLGNHHQLQALWAQRQQSQAVQQELSQLKNPQELIDRLQDRLRQDPQSAQGWYLLGKLYLGQQQYANAESALSRAHELAPNSAETVLVLAKANFFNHGNQLTPAMEKMLTDVLESLTEPVDGLNLLAVNAYQHKHFHQAVHYWQRALSFTVPDSPDSRTLLEMINRAQHQHQKKGVIENGGNN
jgi:cytochrome c-type biogenesis protein CcmH/NrfG